MIKLCVKDVCDKIMCVKDCVCDQVVCVCVERPKLKGACSLVTISLPLDAAWAQLPQPRSESTMLHFH